MPGVKINAQTTLQYTQRQTSRKISGGGGCGGCHRPAGRGPAQSRLPLNSHPASKTALSNPSLPPAARRHCVNASAPQRPSLRGALPGRGPSPPTPGAAGRDLRRPPQPASHPTPRAPALCPAALGAALPACSGGAPQPAPALTRAEQPAGSAARRAAQTGVGAGRARAAPMPAPRRNRVRAGGRASGAGSGRVRPPRLPRPARPASGLGEAALPPPTPTPHPRPRPRPRAGAAVRSAQVGPGGAAAPAAPCVSAPVSRRRARPALEPRASTLPTPRTPGARAQPPVRASRFRRLHSAARSRRPGTSQSDPPAPSA